MKMTARRAVDPIIATLLLIAISVAAGILVYVYVNSLSGGLTGSGGGQLSEQVSMDSYNFNTLTAPVISMRNTGGASSSLTSVFFDGNACQTGNAVCTAGPTFTEPATNGCTDTVTLLPVTCATGQYTRMTLAVVSQTAGTTHTLKVVSATGGTFVMSIVAGRTG
jgi:FlaG/FlaF family flagellin (archaellin)